MMDFASISSTQPHLDLGGANGLEMCMQMLTPHNATGVLLALFTASAAIGPACADAVSDFYRGKDIAIQVGFGAGGGYDTTTRLFARYFGKHIPGNPSVV